MDLAKSEAIFPSPVGSAQLFPFGPGVKPQKSESIQFRSHIKDVETKKSIVMLDGGSRRHSTKDDTRKSSKAQAIHFGRRRFTEMSPPGSQSAINFKSESVPLGGPLKVIREANILSEEIAPKKFGHHKSMIFQGQHLVGSPEDLEVSV
jgi:hypothetical protein